MEVIFDYLCPVSKTDLATIPFKNTEFIEAVSLKMIPFPLDENKHSHEVDQVYFYFRDLCET